MVAALAFADCLHGYTYIYLGIYRSLQYFQQVISVPLVISVHHQSADKHPSCVTLDMYACFGHTVCD